MTKESDLDHASGLIRALNDSERSPTEWSSPLRRWSRHLQPRDALSGRAVLFALLSRPLQARCHPQCCDANTRRAWQLHAVHEAVGRWRTIDTAFLAELPPDVVSCWMCPPDRYIPIQFAQWCGASPTATRVHANCVREVLNDSEVTWQVAMELLRAVVRAYPSGLPKGWVRRARLGTYQRHDNPWMRRWANSDVFSTVR